MRPQRFFIMPRSTARDRRKAAVRLTAITWSHSSSFMRMKRLSRVMPALLTRMSIGAPAAASAALGSASTDAVSERLQVAMKARLAEFGLHRFQRFGARAGEHDRRALRMQRLGDGAADAAGGAGDQCGLACEIKHQSALSRRLRCRRACRA